MALETRAGRQYFYRKKRVGDKVISQYLGTGYSAYLMQRLDEHERQEAESKRQAWQAIKDSEEQLDAQLDGFTEVVNAYVGAHLLISGYHQHRRQWRKKRE